MVLNQTRRVWGHAVYLSCFRSANDWVIIISSHTSQDALVHYQQRWMIETLFQALKGSGKTYKD